MTLLTAVRKLHPPITDCRCDILIGAFGGLRVVEELHRQLLTRLCRGSCNSRHAAPGEAHASINLGSSHVSGCASRKLRLLDLLSMSDLYSKSALRPCHSLEARRDLRHLRGLSREDANTQWRTSSLGKGVHPSDKAAAREPSPSKTRAAPPRRALSAIQPSKLQVAISEPSTKGENLKVAKAEKSAEERKQGCIDAEDVQSPGCFPKAFSDNKAGLVETHGEEAVRNIHAPAFTRGQSASSTRPNGQPSPPSQRPKYPHDPSRHHPPLSVRDLSHRRSHQRSDCRRRTVPGRLQGELPAGASLDSPASRTRSRTAAPSHLHPGKETRDPRSCESCKLRMSFEKASPSLAMAAVPCL